MKNLKEFKELIQRYETITLEEIKETWKENDAKLWRKYYYRYSSEGDYVAEDLTGFGSPQKCILCTAIKKKCSVCVWGIDTTENSWYKTDKNYSCCKNENEKTYKAIEYAKSPEELLQAFRNRAIRMRERLEELNIEV
jgi:hypothetical protein